MSSEGSSSTGSRIRQFGLYRTIDARTEEFLKLSRKRQIRQGCACAAISTVVTVAIVISIVTVYEYSILSESSSKTASKSNWIGLMNASTDTVFDPKLNTAKINLDSTSIQLLPLLLKTLKQSGFYEKTQEDLSSNSFERKEPTEPYSRNIFSEAQNWMKMPISRMYAIEYKTSPIVYFKSTTRSNDYFTKVRKIRDYQRMLNYVNKMINDRVSYGASQPMLKSGYSYYLNRDFHTTPMPIEKVINKKIKYGHTSYKNKPNCICPRKITLLLSKIISSLQNMLPEMNNGTEYLLPCTNEATEASKNFENISEKTKTEENLDMNIKLNKTSVKKYKSPSTTTTKYNQIPRYKFDKDKDHSKIMTLLLSKDKKVDLTTEKQFNFKTKEPPITKKTTGIVPLTSTESKVISEDDFIYIEKPKFNKTRNGQSTISIYYGDYEDDFEVPSNSKQEFNFVDGHSLLVQKKYTHPRPKSFQANIENKIITNDKIITEKNGESSKLSLNTTLNQVKIDNFITNNSIQLQINIITTPKINNFLSTTKNSFNFTTAIKNPHSVFTQKENLVKSQLSTVAVNPKVNDKYFTLYKTDQTDDITIEEEIEKASTENPDFHLKNMEEMIKIFNQKFDKDLKKNITTSPPVEQAKLSINIPTSNSMLPRSRPSYLEIRNDWKPDEIQEYDNTNNYQFE